MGHLKRAKRDMESDKATLVKRDMVSGATRPRAMVLDLTLSPLLPPLPPR